MDVLKINDDDDDDDAFPKGSSHVFLFFLMTVAGFFWPKKGHGLPEYSIVCRITTTHKIYSCQDLVNDKRLVFFL